MCKISFIVPIRNVKNYLARCVNSITVFQSHDYEIILVDDGSTDGSGELADEIAKDAEHITVIHCGLYIREK